MRSSEQILEDAARDGSIDIAEWPRVLENMLQKLHNIVHNDFPLPSVPLPAPLLSSVDPEVVTSTPPRLMPVESQQTSDQDLPDAENEIPSNSQSSTKENDAPEGVPQDGAAPMPGFEVNHTLQEQNNTTLPADADAPLPPQLLSLYNSSTRILERDFAHSPPYTIQRLAEMVLHPRKHYRFLPAYLRALDRIVSVSSPVSDFPLPTLQPSSNGGFLANGDAGQPNGTDCLGSDESLGGALLTPIPWLHTGALTNNANGNASDGELRSESTETIDGPNGTGSVETVSVTVNGVSSASGPNGTSPAPSTATSTTPAGSAAPTSPTLSEQSDASSSSSSGNTPTTAATAPAAQTTEALLREQGGVTQGELLRQEQEAGIIPVTQNSPSHRPPSIPITSANVNLAVGRPSDVNNATSSTTASTSSNSASSTSTSASAAASTAAANSAANAAAASTAVANANAAAQIPSSSASEGTAAGAGAGAVVDPVVVPSDDPSLPHARGPELIGMEDMGPQPARNAAAGSVASGGAGGAAAKLDMEAAVGRKADSPSASSVAVPGGETSTVTKIVSEGGDGKEGGNEVEMGKGEEKVDTAGSSGAGELDKAGAGEDAEQSGDVKMSDGDEAGSKDESSGEKSDA